MSSDEPAIESTRSMQKLHFSIFKYNIENPFLTSQPLIESYLYISYNPIFPKQLLRQIDTRHNLEMGSINIQEDNLGFITYKEQSNRYQGM